MIAQPARGRFRLQIGPDAQRFEHVGAARLRSDGAVAVLGHRHPGGGGDEGDGGGNVKCVEPVAACSANVQNLTGAGFGIQGRGNGFVAQRAGEGGDFRNAFPFARQRCEEFRLDRRGKIRVGQGFHRARHLRVGQRLLVSQLLCQDFKHPWRLEHPANIASLHSIPDGRRRISFLDFPLNLNPNLNLNPSFM